MKPAGWLWPLSIPYQACVGSRNRLYDLGVLKTHHVKTPVISVGNLAAGGTGKTPFVIYLIERLKQIAGSTVSKTVVLSRGYGGSARGTLTVTDGKRMLATCWDAGDEPVLIAEKVKPAKVIVDRNRVRGARFAVEMFAAKLIILDDGFQHRRLGRSLDIVLLDGRNPLGNKRVLPAGFLREPTSALGRADIIVLSKALGTDEEVSHRASQLEELTGKPVVATKLVPKFWRRSGKPELLAAAEIKGKKVLAFAGIAHPDYFFDTAAALGAKLSGTISLPDHAKYTKTQLDHIARQFIKQKAEWLITTEKDAVKLPPILKLLPVYYLEISIQVVAGQSHLDAKLQEVLKAQANLQNNNVSH